MTESAAGWRSGFISGSSEDQMTETGPRQTWERKRRRSKSMSVISPWGDPFSAWTLGSGVPGPVHWPPASRWNLPALLFLHTDTWTADALRQKHPLFLRFCLRSVRVGIHYMKSCADPRSLSSLSTSLCFLSSFLLFFLCFSHFHLVESDLAVFDHRYSHRPALIGEYISK